MKFVLVVTTDTEENVKKFLHANNVDYLTFFTQQGNKENKTSILNYHD